MAGREIWWIRHGESEWNREGRWQGHTDIPLSAVGEEQARRLGKRLRGRVFDGVFASDLARARQTAQLTFPEADLQIDKRLREVNFGDLEGHYHQGDSPEIAAAFTAWWRDPFGTRAPNGESLTDLALRVEEWINSLPAQGKFVVFTHGGVVRTVLWGITGPPPDGGWTISLDNTSITRIYSSSRHRLLCVNDTAHLEDPLVTE